ncbi:MAG: CfrBI family restriction endonuclease [Chloroflexi bacterium]|nr:CfrBI family restriction endonuclease [Chloroflexota bacterium]MBI3732349.1 CfrBI family restriction endonuclease [Chloroflexota bacterium]
MTLTDAVVKNIIRKLLTGEDYRGEIIALIDAEFLQYVIDFFRRIVDAKLKHKNVTIDWYKAELLNPDLPKEDIAIHSGLNMKSISNMYNSATKEIVLEASLEHYDTLYQAIEDLLAHEGVDITLTIKFRGVSVDLNISESLIVINTLAVKRAALRGGLWSTAGKQVEKPLMITLCALHRVPKRHYYKVGKLGHIREVDFYLIDGDGEFQRCEVKLMGKGNPESADAVLARDSKVFVADKLSELNKRQLEDRGVLWVELRNASDFKQFERVLGALEIPHRPFKGDLFKSIDKVLEQVFKDNEDDTGLSLVRESSEYLIDTDAEPIE